MASAEPIRRESDVLRVLAGRLAGDAVVTLRAVEGGRNNGVYYVECARGGRHALKRYVAAGEGHDRLAAEYAALCFLADAGIAAVPRPVGVDREAGCALYEWIDGANPGRAGVADIDAAAAFVAQLHRASRLPEAADLPLAREACLSGDELAGQVERRLSRLLAVAAELGELDDFLRDDLAPALAAATLRGRAIYRAAGLDWAAVLPVPDRTLSPSDFGFHNAVRRPDGTLVFVDFEYFGWDDPVKLTADVLLHPGMELDAPLRRRFLDRMIATFRDDSLFVERLKAQYPLYGLRWCLIMLNEFLPERWARRRFAGLTDRLAAQTLQLSRARGLCARLARDAFEFPMDA